LEEEKAKRREKIKADRTKPFAAFSGYKKARIKERKKLR